MSIQLALYDIFGVFALMVGAADILGVSNGARFLTAGGGPNLEVESPCLIDMLLAGQVRVIEQRVRQQGKNAHFNPACCIFSDRF